MNYFIKKKLNIYDEWFYFFIYIYNSRCLGQLTRIITNLRIHWTSCKFNKQVKHRGNDRHTKKKIEFEYEEKYQVPTTTVRSGTQVWMIHSLFYINRFVFYNFFITYFFSRRRGTKWNNQLEETLRMLRQWLFIF